MKKFAAFVLVAALVMVAAFSNVALGQGGTEWSYEGETGPDNWGTLDESFATCGEGTSQSPIDLVDATVVDLVGIEFEYEEAPLLIFNNGHTIEVEYHEGSYIVYNEKEYELLQFHFHQSSEHTVNGEQYPMELHLVHRDPDSGQLAVVGVLIEEGDASNEMFALIFDNLPAEEGEPNEETELVINAFDLLPENTDSFFTYEGSLTTPPCSQVVRWLVLTTPVTLSADQIAAFGSIYNNNFRPVQPLNARDLFVTE